ncbi:lactadherin-like [Patiria miniata]|uniref:F5/8 type C domain-containing protein n=1 Tax=Patiria miniata TaxID=46514 RepID=A0A914AMG6_PATMI|nr:lactadherin-like [Patiria miniata]
MVYGHACWIGQEPDLASNQLRWALPAAGEASCQCTDMKLGGVNLFQPRRPLHVQHFDAPLGLHAVKKALNCTAKEVCVAEGPLGMGDRRIHNDHITASSQSNLFNHAPWKARLTTDGTFSVWCNNPRTDPAPWIQVDFARDLYVTGLVIQGRSLYNQYVMSYELALSMDGEIWQPLTNADGTARRFTGNEDSVNVAATEFEVIQRTRFLRILSTECHSRCCMRFEVMGCDRTELNP